MKKAFKKVCSKAKELASSGYAKAGIIGGTALLTVSNASAAIVSYDPAATTGSGLTWDFTAILEGEMVVITAAITAGATIFIVMMGYQMAKKLIK